MRNLVASVLLLASTNICYAELKRVDVDVNVKKELNQRAITDTGEEVVLKADGRWLYLKDVNKQPEKISITTNKTVFTKAKQATFLIKSTQNNSAYWLNPKAWTFKHASSDKKHLEYQFKFKNADITAVACTEGNKLNEQQSVDKAFNYIKQKVSDLAVVTKEYRNVNAKKVLFVEMQGTQAGEKVSYLGYFYASIDGTTRYIVSAKSALIEQYKADVQDFLSGLDTQNNIKITADEVTENPIKTDVVR
mgnify:FL=1